jgi:hypothetical protein
VAARLEPHALELLAGAALVLVALAHTRAQVLHARHELIAHLLERAEVEQPRGAARRAGRRRRHGEVGKALGDRRRQLVLEPRDLSPQRSARGALVDSRCSWRLSIDDLLLVVPHAGLLPAR